MFKNNMTQPTCLMAHKMLLQCTFQSLRIVRRLANVDWLSNNNNNRIIVYVPNNGAAACTCWCTPLKQSSICIQFQTKAISHDFFRNTLFYSLFNGFNKPIFLLLSENCAFLLMIRNHICIRPPQTNALSRWIFHHKFNFCFVAVVIYCYADYYLVLRSTAPAIEEVNVTFYADLYQSDGTKPANETYAWVSRKKWS